MEVGKDEVPSSNLGSSSTKSLEPQRFEGFLLFVFGGVISEFVTVLLPGPMDDFLRKAEKKREKKKLKNFLKTCCLLGNYDV